MNTPDKKSASWQQQAGQVAVEYILMLLVIVSVMIPLMKKFDEHFIGIGNRDGVDCEIEANKRLLVCQFGKLFDRQGFEIFSLAGAPKD